MFVYPNASLYKVNPGSLASRFYYIDCFWLLYLIKRTNYRTLLQILIFVCLTTFICVFKCVDLSMWIVLCPPSLWCILHNVPQSCCEWQCVVFHPAVLTYRLKLEYIIKQLWFMVSNLILYDKDWADYIYITIYTFIQSSLSDPVLNCRDVLTKGPWCVVYVEVWALICCVNRLNH